MSAASKPSPPALSRAAGEGADAGGATIVRVDPMGGVTPLFGIAATRRIEASALSGSAPFALMARAGDAAARLALALAPHARHAVVYAGAGHNGGDGFEAAARLRAMGKAVAVVCCGDLGALPRDAATALANARAAGVALFPGFEADAAATVEGSWAPALVIDALLGIGASRAAEGPIAAAIEAIAKRRTAGACVLSIDVPSGLDADRGQPIGAGACVSADDTLTMLAAKPGLFTATGRDRAGRIWLAPLGIDAAGETPDARLVGAAALAANARSHASHKGSYGDVVVIGGAAAMTGAALLAARAAHAAGAGRVWVDLLDPAAPSHDPLRPELMFRAGGWRDDRDAIATRTVVCGCGGGDAVRAALPVVLAIAPRLVLDADALNAIAADPGLATRLALRERRGQRTILTPHPLEAARLLGVTVIDVQGDRLAAATRLADRAQAIVVLKGSGSVIAAPGATPCIVATGNATLASAGTGDVLAGWIGGSWLAGADPFEVALAAAVAHGAAADSDAYGALRAGDLIERLHIAARGAA